MGDGPAHGAGEAAAAGERLQLLRGSGGGAHLGGLIGRSRDARAGNRAAAEAAGRGS
jgi:hypothetical protein